MYTLFPTLFCLQLTLIWNQQRFFFQRKWRVSCLSRLSLSLLFFFVYTSTRFLTFFLLSTRRLHFHWMHASASIFWFDSRNEKFFSHLFMDIYDAYHNVMYIKWHATFNSRDQWNSLMIVRTWKLAMPHFEFI